MILLRPKHACSLYKNILCVQKKCIDHSSKGYKCSDESKSKDIAIQICQILLLKFFYSDTSKNLCNLDQSQYFIEYLL